MAWEDTYTKPNLAHLGITATHERKIKSGAEYEQYFERATGTTEHINDDATVHDTLAFVGVLVNKTLSDTKKIAQVLKCTTLDATCHSIFDFFYQNYQYKLDEIGIEQVRRPSRAWADRKTGIDCDCFTASVSSVLTNLGIEHYLKIIAINGKENFQHIYVVVPKRQGLDINSRANYWVIDPVLNHYDEEAPKITQTKHLKMNGIPLQQLNGIEETIAGLGNEFDGIENDLSGLDDESIGRVFHHRLKQHISNTRAKIERDPQAVAQFYKPHVLLHQMKTLESAMNGTEEHLMGVLEELSNTEHEAIQPQFTGVYDAMHDHDDHLYGVLYGEIDEKMLDGVLGLGRKGSRKGSSAKKAKAAGKGKKGFFTKIKNAKKIIKSGKLKGKIKGAVKKIGRFLKKTNPLAIAARGGFIMAMRTNFGKIAEKAYWGYQTREFARSKGVTDEYYDACVKVKDKVLHAFVKTLGGNEGTLKKPIMNGRAAKKIAKLLKAKGMSGTTEELFGLGGLGVVAAAASATTITAAMAFLTPIIKMISGSFKGKKSGLEKNEKGGESEATSEDPSEEMDKTEAEARNPSNNTIDNDGSIEAADAANDEEPSDEGDSLKKKVATRTKNVVSTVTNSISTGTNQSPPKTKTADTENATEDTDTTAADTTTGSNAKKGISNAKKGISGGAIVGVVGVLGLVAFAVLKGKSKAATNGLGNFSAKRESKSLKQKLTKQGIKMPHGYSVEKRKNKAVKTIKI